MIGDFSLGGIGPEQALGFAPLPEFFGHFDFLDEPIEAQAEGRETLAFGHGLGMYSAQ